MEALRISIHDLSATGGLFDSFRGIIDDLPRGTLTLPAPPVSDPDLIVLGLDGLSLTECREAVRRIRSEQSRIPVIGAVSHAEPLGLLDLVYNGMTDFVTLPLRPSDILTRILRFKEKVLYRNSEMLSIRESLGMRRLIGKSPAFLKEIGKIQQVCKCDASVLVTGETGTGKEMLARAIHYLSPRADKPFVPVNCGAIPADLMENELFGHEREAFTGATGSKSGLIRDAAGGTLFLDEVDSLTPIAQVKFLRFLQEKEFRPLGSTKTQKADVRIVAATNIPPDKAMEEGRIRKDLFFRLNIIAFQMPPLRERKEDIPLLADHFLQKYCKEFGKEGLMFSPGALARFATFSWPGNIRELEHVVQRAVLLGTGPVLLPGDFDLGPIASSLPGPTSFQAAKARAVKEFERNYIEDLLREHQGNISRAALQAGKNRRAFWQLIKKHEIEANSFRSKVLVNRIGTPFAS